MAEVVGCRKGAKDVRLVGAAPREWAEGLELADDDVAVPAEALELAAREEQRLRTHQRTESLVHHRRDDQGHPAAPLPEGHEDDPLRRCPPLARTRRSRNSHRTTPGLPC